MSSSNEPWDIAIVTVLQFVLKSSPSTTGLAYGAVGDDDDVTFKWRVQAQSSTETDLKYAPRWAMCNFARAQ